MLVSARVPRLGLVLISPNMAGASASSSHGAAVFGGRVLTSEHGGDEDLACGLAGSAGEVGEDDVGGIHAEDVLAGYGPVLR